MEKIAPNAIQKFFSVYKLRNKLLNKKHYDLWTQKMKDNSKPPYSEIERQPDYINRDVLSNEQLAALNWIAYSWHESNNVILPDENGDGKLVEIISFLSYIMYEHKISRPFLIVVRDETITQWETALNEWIPEANIINFDGNKVSRELIK